ncbi:putative ubiquitin conjugating enzyme [Aspergillus neoniger CBS 115656]|uniref:Ubiquitin conjugating enzyme n=1 Tax=Aspergillus neoniger (strain CBS 115656) TaxID=1448310 RepID=A0A318YAJ4_ASPNB|nr:ubiquitin conjugating enzyme [Aspergillus neoniger CBS 115656]PYH30547.1 ubiquitin conjugating enzyme [Aspergillus neoniger CBS 115656]
MPWKAFRKDLSDACLRASFPHLSHLRLGDEDSTIAFTYSFQSCMHIEFIVSILDATEYPDDHSYFAFAVTDNIPPAVSSLLETVQTKFNGCSLEIFLEGFCDYLDQAALGKEPRASSPVDDDFDAISDDEDMAWDEYSDAPRMDHSVDMKQLRTDLRAAKSAGFKVGYLGDLEGSFIVSVSCRIASLGISQDAMQMWNVCPKHFIVLLLYYPWGYRSLDHIVSQSQTAPSPVKMYVGLCDRYKPTTMSIPETHQEISSPGVSSSMPKSALISSFITDPLETLLNDRFVSIVQDRLRHGFSWTGAELFYNDAQGKKLDPEDAKLPKYFVPEKWAKFTPGFVKADDLPQHTAHQLSLPLIAMQYSLRRFVKCTEFCLNCHCKIDTGFEALKPYVCSSPLCLYQYMQLGMGPKLEWEIVTQPYVVDMLVSFAYARAAQGQLTDLPSGLGMKVACGASTGSSPPSCTARLDPANMTLMARGPHNLKVGEWILLKPGNVSDSSSYFPSLCSTVLQVHDQSLIEISQPISVGYLACQQDSPPVGQDVQIVPFHLEFDSLSNELKQKAVMLLLDTLPDVFSMRKFIESSTPEHRPLASWHDQICPSALYVLRWILASNRSCIVYDDDPEHQVTGMHNYMQFRLAQGSPDKEARFVQELNNSSSKEFPTLFAWHGSPLYNWHSILREGLNFDRLLNGRAYGDGVYMASDLHTSLAYCCRDGISGGKWSRSQLDITSAISLNEVVNSPGKFRNKIPYVVPQLDWIQSRYLFISGDGFKARGENKSKPSRVYEQDPAWTARGPDFQPVSIPLSALGTRQGQSHKNKNEADGQATDNRQKKRISPAKGLSGLSESSSTTDSNDDTEIEDLRLLDSDSDDDVIGKSRRIDASKSNHNLRRGSKTDFQPGTLQAHSFKLLGPPSYATTAATKSLQRHLKTTLRIQDREPLHEIGWYVDPTLINNVYQWIVEFHSFDPSLPLAQDLKQNGLKSVVMEIRFPPQFPMSPPFVRVVRPRFISFQQRGGGHVTAGGAMCMELLTSSGWLPTSSIDSVFLQVRMALCSTEPWPARIERDGEYPFSEAVSAYRRACQAHGWKIPDDFNRIEAS